MKNLFAAAFAVVLLQSGGAMATPLAIDFNSFGNNVSVSTVGPVTFSLAGGPAVGNPTTTIPSYEVTVSHNMLTNSLDGGPHPTANQLVATFSGVANGLSFTFFNAGARSSGPGNSFYEALGIDGTLLESGSLTPAEDGLVTFFVDASNVHKLIWDNGTGGTENWWFGLASLNAQDFSSATVPEPASIALLGLSLVGLVVGRRRKQL